MFLYDKYLVLIVIFSKYDYYKGEMVCIESFTSKIVCKLIFCHINSKYDVA